MKFTLFLSLLLLITIGYIPNTQAQSTTAIASLDQLSGVVQVRIAKNQKTTVGKKGLLLYQKDIVKTGRNGRTTIVFRDGSIIRLFENSQFEIEKAEELPTRQRSFQYKFFMQIGSLWSHLNTGTQKTEFQTPTTTIGVKGTTFRIKEELGKASVLLTEGSISVANDRETVALNAGQQIISFAREDRLGDKIEEIPHRLLVEASEDKIDFGDSEEPLLVRLTLQAYNLVQQQNFHRSLRILFRSDYPNIEFPETVQLDAQGFARVPIRVAPPQKEDHQFDGKVLIWALIDDANSEYIGDGNVTLNITIPPVKKKLRINSKTGEFLSK